MLCTRDLCDGSATGWQAHLNGSKRLLLALPSTTSSVLHASSYEDFLKRLYHFLDSAVTVSTCKPPLAESENRSTLTNPSTVNVAEESAVYGVPASLFHLLDRINRLAYQRRFRVDEASDRMFCQMARVVEYDIAAACPLVPQTAGLYAPATALPNVAAVTSSPADSAAILPMPTRPHDQATLAFHWSLRLRLHQIVHGYSLTDPLVGTAVAAILHHVSAVPTGHAVETSLVLPLVLAASSCRSARDRATIRGRFAGMERRHGFRRFRDAGTLVETVWERREKGREAGEEVIVNWAQIRYFEMAGLAVF